MGTEIPSHELNGFGKFVSFSFFVVAPALYLLPTYEAWKNQHSNLTAIALVNIFLGWSILGWVVAVVWAFKKAEPVRVQSPTPASSNSPPPVAPKRETKNCPFCAEEVRIAAIKCKHCGSALALNATQS